MTSEKTEPSKPLTKHQLQIIRYRWLYTLPIPLFTLVGWSRYLEHSLKGTLIFSFDVLIFSLASIYAWVLKRRLNQAQSQL